MRLPPRLLVRVAHRLQHVWRLRAQAVGRDELHWLPRVQDRSQALQQAMDRLEKARGCGLELVLPELRQETLDQLEGLRLAMMVAHDAMSRPPAGVPSLANFMAELKDLEAEFDEFHIDWKMKVISATSAPITLQDVYLGPFAIEFHWQRLPHQADDSCFDIKALEPHPAAANSRVTHPHVKDRSLCAGDAAVPIRKALAQGRLADVFFLIRSVLDHYNPDSPHVPLDDWGGMECHDCGRTVRDDDRWSCEGCGCEFCEECIGGCSSCDAYRCHGCLTVCDLCGDRCCARCLEDCAGRDCCRRCLASCAFCGASVARDQLDVRRRCSFCQSRDSQSPETNHDPDPESARPTSA